MTVHRENRSQRGSVLIAFLIFSAILALVIGTLLPSMVTDFKMNSRSYLQIAGLAIAESGAEEGFWALNHLGDVSEWTNDGWTEAKSGRLMIKEFTIQSGSGDPFTLSNDRKARIRVVVEPGANSSRIYSEGVILDADDNVLARDVVELVSQISSPFMGLIAKDSINFNGQPQFDSYDSSVFPYSYSSGINSGSNVTVGSINDASGSVDIGNADVYGNVVSGDDDPLVSGAVSVNNGNISGDVIGGFNMVFPDVPVPDTTGWATSF